MSQVVVYNSNNALLLENSWELLLKDWTVKLHTSKCLVSLELLYGCLDIWLRELEESDAVILCDDQIVVEIVDVNLYINKICYI